MYTEREAFDAMMLFRQRHPAQVPHAPWPDWLNCLKEATRTHAVVIATTGPIGLVEEAEFIADEYIGSLPPMCPACEEELLSPHPACRDVVQGWMKLLR